MLIPQRRQSGFTIVELLIVIVIIAILAAITLVAYNSVQSRARDTQRLSDAAAIKKALALYRIDKDSYPAAVPNPGNSTWEISTDPGFLGSLSAYTGAKVFQDPINKGSSVYWYRTFGAGDYGCPVSAGAYYVLWLKGMETQSAANIQSGPCNSQTLFVTTPTAGAWTVGKNDLVIYGF